MQIFQDRAPVSTVSPAAAKAAFAKAFDTLSRKLVQWTAATS